MWTNPEDIGWNTDPETKEAFSCDRLRLLGNKKVLLPCNQ
jgi:hypothetical protein